MRSPKIDFKDAGTIISRKHRRVFAEQVCITAITCIVPLSRFVSSEDRAVVNWSLCVVMLSSDIVFFLVLLLYRESNCEIGFKVPHDPPERMRVYKSKISIPFDIDTHCY